MADLDVLKTQLFNIMRDMEVEGLVDRRLGGAYAMKQIQECGPYYIVHLIPTFMNDSCATFRDIAEELEKPEVDFKEIDEFIFKIKGASSCIGACRMADVCREFQVPIQEKSKQQCLVLLDALKREFSALQEKLCILLEIERMIVAYSAAK